MLTWHGATNSENKTGQDCSDELLRIQDRLIALSTRKRSMAQTPLKTTKAEKQNQDFVAEAVGTFRKQSTDSMANGNHQVFSG